MDKSPDLRTSGQIGQGRGEETLSTVSGELLLLTLTISEFFDVIVAFCSSVLPFFINKFLYCSAFSKIGYLFSWVTASQLPSRPFMASGPLLATSKSLSL